MEQYINNILILLIKNENLIKANALSNVYDGAMKLV